MVSGTPVEPDVRFTRSFAMSNSVETSARSWRRMSALVRIGEGFEVGERLHVVRVNAGVPSTRRGSTGTVS